MQPYTQRLHTQTLNFDSKQFSSNIQAIQLHNISTFIIICHQVGKIVDGGGKLKRKYRPGIELPASLFIQDQDYVSSATAI